MKLKLFLDIFKWIIVPLVIWKILTFIQDLPIRGEYSYLEDMLEQHQWDKAAAETEKLIDDAAISNSGGKNYSSNGLMTDSEVTNFPCQSIKIIDRLWQKHSDGKFGFSVQTQTMREALAFENVQTLLQSRQIWNTGLIKLGWTATNNDSSNQPTLSNSQVNELAPKGFFPPPIYTAGDLLRESNGTYNGAGSFPGFYFMLRAKKCGL
jgi:hypothetical protein